jgi:hypothetical protein
MFMGISGRPGQMKVDMNVIERADDTAGCSAFE